VLTRVLAALTQAREPLSVLEIFAAGWPDESASHESARARVYMAISTLRRLGLRSHLVRHPESGYQLVPPAHPAAATPSVG
jgi:DNA-binding winged helix-turn-helix (wHTH) protein